ncbi:MAG: PPOX class F420-dependent oxidoreductase, partial [Nitrosopumilaceae archaeon]|nr:PPOX class F420-dependent oxidoreductase [Nitrosopumilaceae archaeon]NIU01555.1 PPOX class F420-dependent oxidoreductase [Nitrosopumilaceae archaeon]NIU87974.1 PPOX class F420-dependent oxidoreductase [Nitrosopumilaceae archaeon]NIV65306.1 PPOX class F420-dependent oxidoreductase [Nitrosopumilaceae archaeon]NIX62157.1 PPOX class F420-dependent oxidoreductase [Nitrosopumilaceae archaeon]
ADKLTKQYLDREHYPFKQPGEKRIIFKIKPERVFIMPELKWNDE